MLQSALMEGHGPDALPGSDGWAAGSDIAGARPAPSERAAETGPPHLPPGIARRTGVVLVHGLGSQGPSETFLDWSTPIVRLLTEWRAHPDTPSTDPRSGNGIDDPIWRAEFTFARGTRPYLEIAIPPHAGAPETTWVVTEARWAGDIRRADLDRTVLYLGKRMRTLINGIATGYRHRTVHLRDLAVEAGMFEDDQPPLSWRIIELLDRAQAAILGAPPVGFFVFFLGSIVLTGYRVVRRIPIQLVKDVAAEGLLDSFLVDWFGDLPTLLDEPVQAANVRARVAGTVKRLRDDGCDAVVIVAHSGGALVSFSTLLDPAYLDIHVDKLVTMGQGLGLAWRLAADPEDHQIPPGSRIVGNLAAVRPDLRWVDVWASYDPATAGPLPSRGGLVVTSANSSDPEGRGSGTAAAIVESGEGPESTPWLVRRDVGAPNASIDAVLGRARGDPGRPYLVVESRPVTNEMNLFTDHGAYWSNAEGFLVPLVRHIDAALGEADASRFFRDDVERLRRIAWRQERVAVLASWSWLSVVATIVTVAGLALMGWTGDGRLAAAGSVIAGLFAVVPGSELITVPIDLVGDIIQALADAVGLGDLVRTLGGLGPALIGTILVILLFVLVHRIGTNRWHDWDEREAIAMLPETPRLPDRSRAAAFSVALVGGLLAVVLACFGIVIGAGLALIVGGLIGLVVWVVRPFRPATDPRTSIA